MSRATMKNIRQNLFLAFIYNTLGIPIAAGILYPLTGWLLNPIIAGGAMAFIALLESGIGNRYGGNSKLLKGFRMREMSRALMRSAIVPFL
ncbi:MAG: hypothetical protein F6K22_04705 [Okeania sp. SIO2F4]|nr:hypothetical protein [Okeania sp. SIO2F4]NES02195.1 hypothetical protein [Okeania sp. SIO2F4]